MSINKGYLARVGMTRYLPLVLLLLIWHSARSQWVSTNGPNGGVVKALAVVPNRAGGTMLFAGTDGAGVFRSSDNGTSWKAVCNGLTNSNVPSLIASGTTLFAGTHGGGVFRSTDGGDSWMPASANLTDTFVVALVVSGKDLFAGTGHWWLKDMGGGIEIPWSNGGIFRSTNDGASWTEIDSGLTSPIRAFGVSGTTLYATDGSLVIRSTDSGFKWTSVSPIPGVISAFAVSGDTLFVASEGVFISTDGGSNWTKVTPSEVIGDVLSLIVRGSTLFAGTNGAGIYLSSNDGSSWTPVNAGLARTAVTSLAVSGNSLLAGTDDSVWRRPLSEMITSAVEPRQQLPVRFSLEQNYPNPFNPTTTIRYALPLRSHVTLTFYNTLGQKIDESVNGDIDAGNHEVQFNAPNLASGVYFYRLQAGTYTETKKFVLTR